MSEPSRNYETERAIALYAERDGLIEAVAHLMIGIQPDWDKLNLFKRTRERIAARAEELSKWPE